ncbi:hypothetical protein BDV96DRAFT_695021 [Lophiotrema nucula]|uniref:Chromo domain-containing protein n=1 Tax=Lophiotrema nucula TaxID=690887 RepID=A0A6A5YGB7_9PLEO|nr:hypothetical protein BDV96DRAFT_695021 [Lophiotrema nucula]
MTSSAKLPVERKAKAQSRLSTREAIGNSDDSDDHNDTDDNNNRTRTARSVSVTRKRKRSPLAERHSRMPRKTWKHRSKDARHSARPLLPHSGPLSNHPSAPHSLPALQESSHDNKMYYNDDSSDDCSEEGSDSGSNTQPRSTAGTYRPRRNKWKRNRRSADEDNEYEVERILESRINRRKLQSRTKWVGYGNDPEWYDASNFKNSPDRLRDFTRPTLPNQGRQKGCGGGHSVGRRTEIWRTTLMITNPRDHIRGVQRPKDTRGWFIP